MLDDESEFSPNRTSYQARSTRQMLAQDNSKWKLPESTEEDPRRPLKKEVDSTDKEKPQDAALPSESSPKRSFYQARSMRQVSKQEHSEWKLAEPMEEDPRRILKMRIDPAEGETRQNVVRLPLLPSLSPRKEKPTLDIDKAEKMRQPLPGGLSDRQVPTCQDGKEKEEAKEEILELETPRLRKMVSFGLVEQVEIHDEPFEELDAKGKKLREMFLQGQAESMRKFEERKKERRLQIKQRLGSAGTIEVGPTQGFSVESPKKISTKKVSTKKASTKKAPPQKTMLQANNKVVREEDKTAKRRKKSLGGRQQSDRKIEDRKEVIRTQPGGQPCVSR